MTGGEPCVAGVASPAWCEHGPCAHDPAAYGPDAAGAGGDGSVAGGSGRDGARHDRAGGELSSAGTAPGNVRAWLLIEHNGPWAAEAVETALPTDLAKLAIGADEMGVRVQLIRRPRRPGLADGDAGPAIFAGWTEDPGPWLRRIPAENLEHAALEMLAEGKAPGGAAVDRPLYLVCTHGRRDRCCARFGVPLARDLAARYPEEVWETTHVGGHRFAANLVILPRGLYYGPVDSAGALDAVGAYARGEIVARGYRGRAGLDATAQESECAAAAGTGTLKR